ncbi:MAG: hypothetical protein H7Y22_06940 [Gemmatimonadaceae bacterium]|nr:hypothetical protein [Gloeobacterales cyanobacterium ES-bin-141]
MSRFAETGSFPTLIPVNRFYTGIGSSQVPSDIAALFLLIAQHLAAQGMILRTGPSKGTDAAFAAGACEQRQVFLPHSGAGGYKDGSVVIDPNIIKRATAIAVTVHPNWKTYNDFQRKAHTRAVYLVLGSDLISPSAYVLCYTPINNRGQVEGATRTVLALANERRIPVYNLAEFEIRSRFRKRLEELALPGGHT